MMKEALISFKTAKLAKEKGFILHQGHMKMYRDEDGHLFDNIGPAYDILSHCSHAPTQSLIQKWLREKHKIYAYIDWHDCSSVLFKDGLPEYVEVFEHMDLEKLLQEALKLI